MSGSEDELPTLTVTGGSLDGRALTVQRGVPSTLGSAQQSTLCLELGNVDPSHAQVVWDAGALLISDLGSSTGTYVNGEKIGHDHSLQEGDRVFLGPPGSKQTAKLAVHLPATVAAPPDEPEIIADDAEPVIEAAQAAPAPPSASQAPPRPSRAEPSTAPAPPPLPREARPTAPRKPEYTNEMPSIVPERPAEGAEAPPPPPSAPIRPRVARKPPPPRVPRIALLGGAAALVALGGAVVAYKLLLQSTPPVLNSITPPLAEGGQTVTLAGAGFGTDPQKVVVHFGDVTGKVLSASGTEVAVNVPERSVAAGSANVSVSVETGDGRSNALFFKLSAAPRIESLSPDVALPGQIVELRGRNLGQKPVVAVSGNAAEVVEVREGSLRFKIPDIPVTPGEGASVVVQLGTESSRPAPLFLGRLPLLTGVAPPQGSAGDRVTVKGRGFDPNPVNDSVSFAGVPALVFTATEREIVVAAPSVASPSAQVDAPIVVRSRGRDSNPIPFQLLRSSPGYFVPRYFPVPVTEHPGADHAFVSTDLGPVLLLGGRAGASST
ncbi:MAG TPA: IPT/TIG domain-containing protein, partial [Vicinamibacteria bacterium]